MSPSLQLPLLSVFALAGNVQATHVAQPPETEARQELQRLLGVYDQSQDTAERKQLEAQIDALAGQRYATWSRLYWHTDLAEAESEAQASGKPILSLRMLGRLDQDLSCANSRFFRVALYANEQVSAYLRQHFVLHWSSERPVPVARIDFGDGRVVERTVAGNSAHYVLDAQGRPVDVLPGAYTPGQFLELLRAVEPLAARAGQLDDRAFAAAVSDFHRGQLRFAQARFEGDGNSLASAERVTVTKMRVEMPVVKALSLGVPASLAEIRTWKQGDDHWEVVATSLSAKVGGDTLDARSRALVQALGSTDWDHPGTPLPAPAREKLIATFEHSLRVDSAYNELALHPQIHDWFAGASAPLRFEELNGRIYRELFKTPAGDPWLGMATPGLFTGLPGDGVTVH